VRDFARFITTSRGIAGWATVSTGHIEAFLAARPSMAAHRLAGLRRFFRFATRRRLVLTDPAKASAQRWGFRGPSLTLDHQRELFRRRTPGRHARSRRLHIPAGHSASPAVFLGGAAGT
jgi:site-specific recombinase XerD